MIRWKFCLGRKVFSSPSCNFHHSICALVLFTNMNLASSFFTARFEICRGTGPEPRNGYGPASLGNQCHNHKFRDPRRGWIAGTSDSSPGLKFTCRGWLRTFGSGLAESLAESLRLSGPGTAGPWPYWWLAPVRAAAGDGQSGWIC